MNKNMVAKEKLLTSEDVKELFNYNPSTGIFTRCRATCNAVTAGEVVGSKMSNGYLTASRFGKMYRLHRLAWIHYYGEWPDGDVDHINGIRSDNRLDNLRVLSRSYNNLNKSKANSQNKLGVLGVSVCKKSKRYVAEFKIDGKRYHKRFDLLEEAEEQYLEWKSKYIGVTRTNV